MIAPAPIAMAPRYPYTAMLCLAAVTVSLASMFGLSTEPFLLDERAFWQEPWRIVLTVLPHGSPMHLFFNVFWTWVLGVAVEHLCGRRVWLAIVLPAAIVGGTAQFAFSQTPIGLSGVVYALFTFLWVVSRRVPQLRPLVDRQTAIVFLVWFFVCIGLTAMRAMNIANIAHGAGALLGAIAGLAVTSAPSRRNVMVTLGGMLVGLSLLAASSWRLWVNPDGVARTKARAGYELIDQGDPAAALSMLEEARKLQPESELIELIYIEAAYRSERYDLALRALDQQHASKARGGYSHHSVAIAGGEWCLEKGKPQVAADFARRAATLVPTDSEPWVLLGMSFEQRGLDAAALLCFNRAWKLEPDREDLADLIALITRKQSLVSSESGTGG